MDSESMKKWVIYNALFGNYDQIEDPEEAWEEFDFICFTDQKGLQSKVWQFVFVNNEGKSSVLLNRKYKMLPHLFLSQYEISLYLDVNIKPLKNPREMIVRELRDKDFYLPRHSLRDCLYEEAKECVIFKKSGFKETMSQLSKYEEEGFPRKFGLTENGIMLRRHNVPLIKSLMEQWWVEFGQGSKRDQLSLPYVFWKNGQELPSGDFSADDQINFKKYPHKNEVRSLLEKVILSLGVRFRRLYFYFLIG
jgi:hypothetical protein